MSGWFAKRRLRRLLRSEEGQRLLTVQAIREDVFQTLFERLMVFDEEQGLFRPVSTGLTVHAVKKLHRRLVVRGPSRKKRQRAGRSEP